MKLLQSLKTYSNGRKRTGLPSPDVDSATEPNDARHAQADNENGDLVSASLNGIAQAALAICTLASPLPYVGDTANLVEKIITLCQEVKANKCV